MSDPEDLARAEVERHLASLKKWIKLQTTAARHIAGEAKIVEGYFELYPGFADEFEFDRSAALETASATSPSGAEITREILQSTPGEAWAVSEILNNMRSRGITLDSDNPANVVRAALERLVKAEDSDVHKSTDAQDRVIYWYDPDRTGTGPSPSQPSGGGRYDPDEEPF